MAKEADSSVTQVVATVRISDRLSILKSRLSVAKTWSKKPHKAWKKWIREYDIEDVDDTAEIRDKVRIGYIFRHVESDLPSIFDDQPEIFIKGVGDVKILDPLVRGTYSWLWNIQNLEEVVEDAATYFLLLGLAGIDSPWVTKTKKVIQQEMQPVADEQGQSLIDPATGQPQMQSQDVPYEVPLINRPAAETVNLFKVYFSPETKFGPILDYKHCPYYFREYVMTKEEIKARFGKEVDADESLKIYDDDDTDEEVSKLSETSQDVRKDDMKRAHVYEYYGCLPESLAKDITDEQDKAVEWEYDKDYHIWFTKNEELKSESCPYENKPLHLIGNYGLANRFWKFGDAKHLRPLVQELEMLRSQNLKHARRLANPKALIPSDAEVDEKLFRDPREGVTVKYTPGPNGSKPEYMIAPRLGNEVGVGIQEARTDLEKTGGSFDLSTGASQSSVKTPRGIQTFSEAADKNVRRKKKKIARLIRQLIIFQFKQLSMYWQPDGTETIDVITGGTSEKLPVVEEVLQLLGDPDILAKLDIEVESLSVNRVQVKQDSLDLFDLASKFPYIFNLDEMAKDLLQNGFGKKDADRYLATDDQKQQYYNLMKVNRANIRAAIQLDGADPIAAQVLENEGFLEQGQGQQLSQAAEAAKQQHEVSTSLPYKDLPPEGQVQKAAQGGIQITPEGLAHKDALMAHQKNATQTVPVQQAQGGGDNGVR